MVEVDGMRRQNNPEFLMVGGPSWIGGMTVKLDLIVSADVVHTLDPGRRLAQRIGIWNGLIVGVDEQLDGLDVAERIEHKGVVLPGFIDAHTHLQLAGQALCAVDIGGLDSVDAIIARVAEEAAGLAEDAWVEISGYDQRILDRDLTSGDLDAAVGKRRAWARHKSSHSSVISTAVIEAIPDAESRALAMSKHGILHEHEQTVVQLQRLPYALTEVADAVAIAANVAADDGITMCIEAGAGGSIGSLNPLDLMTFQSLFDQERMPIRVQVMPSHDALHHVRGGSGDFRRGLDLGLRTGMGSDRLGVGPMKFVVDGGMAVRSALLTEPYEGTQERGMFREDPQIYRSRILDAIAGGWQLAVHAIGDAALDSALDFLTEGARTYPQNRQRHRIEHGGLIRDDQIPRLVQLGVSVVGQSCFLWTSGDDYSKQLGPQRTLGLYRGRSLLDAGIRLIGSTDRPLPGTPLQAIQTSVERLSDTGLSLAQAESISVAEAVAAWTVDAAWIAGMENRLGRIRSGYLADLVLLGDDPYTAATSEIADIPITGTMVGGRLRMM